MAVLHLEQLHQRFAVCRFAAGIDTPDWLLGHEFVFTARTPDEVSIIAPSRAVPKDVRAERHLTGYRIAGKLDFSETGILSSVSGLLAGAGIPVLGVSTFDTDYFFVPLARDAEARDAFERAGQRVLPVDSPFVKICCISSVDEAETAIDFGASALGLVSEMPSGPGVIPEATIADISAAAAGCVETVLLTSRTEPVEIAAQVRRTGVSGVQLCAWLDETGRKELRGLLADTMLMQVVHVVDAQSAQKAASAQKFVDRLLLDSGTLTGRVMELGGTGRTHDWEISRRIVEEASVPVLLAGGLHAGNVGEAIGTVRPFGVDVCSGVRVDGRLNRDRLGVFFDAVSEGGQLPEPAS